MPSPNAPAPPGGARSPGAALTELLGAELHGAELLGVLELEADALQVRISGPSTTTLRHPVRSVRLAGVGASQLDPAIAGTHRWGPDASRWTIGKIEAVDVVDESLVLRGSWGTISGPLEDNEVLVPDRRQVTVPAIEAGERLEQAYATVSSGSDSEGPEDLFVLLAAAQVQVAMAVHGATGAQAATVAIGPLGSVESLANADGSVSITEFDRSDLWARLADRTGLSRAALRPPAHPDEGDLATWVSCRIQTAEGAHEARWVDRGAGGLWVPQGNGSDDPFDLPTEVDPMFQALLELLAGPIAALDRELAKP